MVRKTAVLCFALLIVVFTACACDNPDTNPAGTVQSKDEPSSAPEVQSASEAPQANDSTERYIINSEGGYRLTLPEDWLGKVLYETDATSIVIHHVTHDSSQPEQNPIIVNIGMTETGQNYDGESFMEIGSNVFYYIPLFDLPYTQDSEDAIEFLALHEQTPAMLNTLELISEGSHAQTQQAQSTPLLKLTGEAFNESDTYFGDIHLGDSKDDVISKVGEPESSNQVTWESTGEIRDVNIFEFGQLIFVEDKLVLAQMYDDTYPGPRGINVGMSLEDVVALFTKDVEVDEEYMTIFYRANPGQEDTYAVPPSAVLYKGELQTLVFSEFTGAGGGKDMSVDELSDGSYMFVEQYDLICEFNSQNTLLRYSVSVGTPSE